MGSILFHEANARTCRSSQMQIVPHTCTHTHTYQGHLKKIKNNRCLVPCAVPCGHKTMALRERKHGKPTVDACSRCSVFCKLQLTSVAFETKQTKSTKRGFVCVCVPCPCPLNYGAQFVGKRRGSVSAVREGIPYTARCARG